MLLEKERKLVVEYGKKLVNLGLTKGTGGNISICNMSIMHIIDNVYLLQMSF